MKIFMWQAGGTKPFKMNTVAQIMVHANVTRPFVYMCDSTVKWTKEIWPDFSKLGFLVME